MTEIDKAIILGAGLGTRLKPITENKPKPLLKINDKTILEHQIECLRKIDINNIYMVVGHHADKIKQFCEHNSLDLDFIYNPKYSNTNNFYSLQLAKTQFDGGFVSLNSDVVFEKSGLDELVNSGEEVNMLVEPKTCSEEDMKVSLGEGKRVKKVSKKLNDEKVYGEFTGIVKFTAKSISKVKKVIEKISPNRIKNMFLGSALQIMSEENIKVSAVDMESYWKDIDSPGDLKEAREHEW